MKTTISFLLFFILGVIGYSQNEINQLDSDGNKHGVWMVYLDNEWAETDKEDAVCYRYTYYAHGVDTKPMGPSGKKKWTLSPKIPKSSEPVELTGELQWSDKKGIVRSIHIFENGKYLSYKEYDSSGNLEQHFDYATQYKDEPHTYYVRTYKKGSEVTWVMRSGTNGWTLYSDPGVGSADDVVE